MQGTIVRPTPKSVRFNRLRKYRWQSRERHIHQIYVITGWRIKEAVRSRGLNNGSPAWAPLIADGRHGFYQLHC